MRRSMFLMFLFLFAAGAFAQQAAPAQLTWLRYYQVERGREADFMRLVRETSKPLMQRLEASKVIDGWGVAVRVTHDREDWTHIIYVGLPDWSAAEKVGQSMEAADAALTPAQMKEMGQLVSSIRSVRDVVLRHVVQGGTLAAQPKYIAVDTYVIKPGRESDAVALFNEWARPGFTSDAVAARMPLWGFSVQDLQTSDSWTHMVWSFLSDLGTRDAMNAAMMSLEPRKLQGFEVRLRDMSDVTAHRASILRIVMP